MKIFLELLGDYFMYWFSGIFLLVYGMVIQVKCKKYDMIEAKCLDCRPMPGNFYRGVFEYEYRGVQIRQAASISQFHKLKIGENYQIYVSKENSRKIITETTRKEE